MRSRVLVAVALTGLASGVSAAPLWTVERSEIAHLYFGEPGKPVLSISCGQEDGDTGRDETRIKIEVETGTKAGTDKAVLRVMEEKGSKELPLEPLVCRGSSECKTRPDGEVYRYETSVPGKSLALDIAGKAKALSIDAPGAKFTAPADPAAFKKFRVSCLNW
jgi:hypothetical protein